MVHEIWSGLQINSNGTPENLEENEKPTTEQLKKKYFN